jgi:ssDNA thymidine ADP-ribosyltransferase, DarT
MPIPDQPKIYHIVHVDNLASIVKDGVLWPDSIMVNRQGAKVIGNSEIKADRLVLPVDCHPGTFVGEFVPFYLCPRSVMLYVISRGNHPNVSFRDGQGPVIHLVSDMKEVVDWASAEKRNWAFTDINAANRAADFYKSLNDLDRLNWEAINANNWRSCRDHKMAEFLVHQAFPWHLVSEIGVHSEKIGARANLAFGSSRHRPPVVVRPNWYY